MAARAAAIPDPQRLFVGVPHDERDRSVHEAEGGQACEGHHVRSEAHRHVEGLDACLRDSGATRAGLASQTHGGEHETDDGDHEASAQQRR